jgi:hypothetical protein
MTNARKLIEHIEEQIARLSSWNLNKEAKMSQNNLVTTDDKYHRQWVSKVTGFSSEYPGWEHTKVIGKSNTYPE